jgi:hypothetical protein
LYENGEVSIMSNKQVVLEILNPRGELANPERRGLFAPRPTDLNGKTIAVMALWSDSEAFFATITEMLKEKYPDVKFVYPESMHSPFAQDKTAEVAEMCDAWLDGVKASTTGGRMDAAALLEMRGKPGVSVCTDAVLMLKKLQSDFNGVPTCRVVSVPATDYITAKMDPELMKSVAAAAFDDIHRALTEPLTREEQEVSDLIVDETPLTFSGATYTEAYEKFQQYCVDNAMGDGMPVVPPTREAVEWMLTGTTYPRDKLIGLMEPKLGKATVEKIAISAVMAGARPEYLPVIIAMVEAITDERFNQYHIVNEILPVFFISGPIVEEIGLNNESGYLAPGHRANATIGRALLMCMINIGWRDMKYYSSPGGAGQPAAYANYVIPENQKESPWPSYAESCGFLPDESVVTVCETLSVVRGPSETLFMETYEQRLEKMRSIFSQHTNVFSRFGMPPRGNPGARHMIAMHPTMARQLANAGFTRESFIQWLHDVNTIDWDKMSEQEREEFKQNVKEGKVSEFMRKFSLDDCRPGLLMEPFSDIKHVALMITGTGAGGTIVFSTSAGSTTLGVKNGKPLPYMQKVIRGAALTKAGK